MISLLNYNKNARNLKFFDSNFFVYISLSKIHTQKFLISRKQKLFRINGRLQVKIQNFDLTDLRCILYQY